MKTCLFKNKIDFEKLSKIENFGVWYNRGCITYTRA